MSLKALRGAMFRALVGPRQMHSPSVELITTAPPSEMKSCGEMNFADARASNGGLVRGGGGTLERGVLFPLL